MPHSANAVRPAAVAGAFYPGNALQLAQQVDSLLAGATAVSKLRPKALIVPHAGYLYSGPVAATAYAAVAAMTPKPSRVVLLGPSHHVGFKGVALPGVHALATPLGLVEVDEHLVDLTKRFSFVGSSPLAHKREHSLEVQLPFLQRVLGHFKVLPLIVGQMKPADIAALLSAVWGGPETLVVVSSDLSHYLTFEEAQATDRHTAECIGALDGEHLASERICGAEPVRGLLVAAKEHHLHAHVLDLRNSGETAGNRARVVGYGAFSFADS
jgi:MEMO1 family protein